MLDDRVTLLSLFKLCFGDVLVDLIFGCTKLYSRREKADISFEITNEKCPYFPACYCFVGVTSFQTVNKMYWEQTADIFCRQGLIQCFVIGSSVFFRIFIFVATKNFINNTNCRSSFLFNKSNKRFLKFFFNRQNKSTV